MEGYWQMLGRSFRSAAVAATLLVAGCGGRPHVPRDTSPTASPADPACRLDAAVDWITGWFTAWEFTSEKVLGVGESAPPEIVFYDASCVYTTSQVTAGGAGAGNGPALRGRNLPWRALKHDDVITLPDSSRVPVQLMAFAAPGSEAGAFLVMAAPELWAEAGIDSKELGRERLLTAVFLHEFAHTLQVPGFQGVIGPIDEEWTFSEELSDDVVQERFGADSAYAAAYAAERDLLYRAADAESLGEARALANEALAMMKARHARWLTEESEVFAILDDAFLAFEGAGQWVGHAWLAHPSGGGVRPDLALAGMRRDGRRWTQDEGLGLFLVIDRLLPSWPSRVFGKRPAGAVELLEVAIRVDGSRNR